jgi:hypothetical protein
MRATLFTKSPTSNRLVVAPGYAAAAPAEDTPGWGPRSQKAGVIYAHISHCPESSPALRTIWTTGLNEWAAASSSEHTDAVLSDEDAGILHRSEPVDVGRARCARDAAAHRTHRRSQA